MARLWLPTPILRRASAIFMAVVVLPLPDGPDSSTIGHVCTLSAMARAARSILAS